MSVATSPSQFMTLLFIIVHRLLCGSDLLLQRRPRVHRRPGLAAPGSRLRLALARLQQCPAGETRFPARPDFGYDAYRHNHNLIHGAPLQLGLHGRGEGIPAFLRFPFAVLFLDARPRGGNQHFPDVHILGARGRLLLPAHRLLL